MPQRTLTAFNYMIAGYTKNGQVGQSLNLFRRLVLCVLLLLWDDVLSTALVDLYVKSGRVGYARRVFDFMMEKDVVCSTSMISGYMREGCVEDAEEVFEKTGEKDVVVFNAMIEGLLLYDRIFTLCPLKYAQGEMKDVNDTNFDEMSYERLLEIVKREIKSDQDIIDMLKVGYENGNEIDMYVEHFDYVIMQMDQFEENEEQNENIIDSSNDCHEIENVDFQTKGDDNVVIKNISTEDPFLNKLCSSRILFRGNGKCRMPDITKTLEVDLDDNQIDSFYKVQRGVVYPAFDPYIPWDKMEPMLGMRNVTEGRCVGKKGNRDRLMPNKVRTGVSKGKQGNKAIKNKADKKKKIKSLICRNYNLGSLVTYKWIALHYCKYIIDDTFMPLRKMKDDIRQKFMIDMRQCRRAK
ncbi:F-box domain containing protein [Tanacetum coccineum]